MLKWKICSLELLGSTAPFPLGKEVEEGAYDLIKKALSFRVLSCRASFFEFVGEKNFSETSQRRSTLRCLDYFYDRWIDPIINVST